MLYVKEANLTDLEKEWLFVKEMPEDENGLTNAWPNISRDDFESIALPAMIRYAKGIDLPDWMVPETFLFLWDDDEIVGQFRIRHYLNDALREGAGHIGYCIGRQYRGKHFGTVGLKLTLEVARDIVPEDEFYLRVNKDNPASLQVMLKNGGRIVGENEDKLFVRISNLGRVLDACDTCAVKKIIDEAIEYVIELFEGNSDGHGADHALRVYHNAQIIMESHPEADSFVIALATLLHDADDHKLFTTNNNANARVFLEKKRLPIDKIDYICEIINVVSFSKNRGKTPDTIEGKIVQDADRIDAIGAIGIARTFAFGGKTGRPLEDSIKHFYDKLLLLKEELNTDSAKELAQKRHDYMVEFLEEYYAETGYRYEGTNTFKQEC